jgi:hypothetical protein
MGELKFVHTVHINIDKYASDRNTRYALRCSDFDLLCQRENPDHEEEAKWNKKKFRKKYFLLNSLHF